MHVGLTSGMNEISALSSSVSWFCGTPLPNWALSSMNVVNYCVVIWRLRIGHGNVHLRFTTDIYSQQT